MNRTSPTKDRERHKTVIYLRQRIKCTCEDDAALRDVLVRPASLVAACSKIAGLTGPLLLENVRIFELIVPQKRRPPLFRGRDVLFIQRETRQAALN
jgi:hypothetical protein